MAIDRNADIQRAIKQRDVGAVTTLMFEGSPPVVRSGFRTECELWDYKSDCPWPGKRHANAWASLAADVLAFHNLHGGVLILGISDADFTFVGCKKILDSKMVNDQLRRWLGDRIWVEFHREFIQEDQRYVGVAIVPPRGPTLVRFGGDAPTVNGRQRFGKGFSAIRDGDTTRILDPLAVDELSRQQSAPLLGRVYEIDEPFYRVLAPEYRVFVKRDGPCRDVLEALSDARSAVSSIVGMGGVGKTALGTWAVLRAYEQRQFDFIVSVTAKDRELTTSGIQALKPGVTSFEGLMAAIADVLQFPEIKGAAPEDQEAQVRDLLANSNGLLYVDNLETVDDPRLLHFLDDLPIGVRAIVTSRRSTVRVSVHPVDLGPLTDAEAASYIGSLADVPGLGYVGQLSESEGQAIGRACDGIPLAIRWTLNQSDTAADAVRQAEEITSKNHRGEELLEFCFRRVFDDMSGHERRVLQVLSLFQRPIAAEALQVGCAYPHHAVMDAMEDLIEDALLQRLFDPDLNDYCYTLLPIVRSFVYNEVTKERELEHKIRRRMSDWFEAKDIRSPEERVIIREIRRGRGAAEEALVDLAKAAVRRGDFDGAERLFDQALQRSPVSWRAAREYAEFERHSRDNKSAALALYERAAANAPSRGPERALVFREYGILLRDSGEPDATDRAIEKFEESLKEKPNDPICCVALAGALERKGSHSRVIELLWPLRDHTNSTTRSRVLPLLLQACERTHEIVKGGEIRERMRTASAPT